jgi:hypothetical protein
VFEVDERFGSAGESTFRGAPFSVANLAGSVTNLALPTAFSLEQNYPNPFNPTTSIRYLLAENSEVVLEVFDVGGNRIRLLDSGQRDAGTYQVTWDGQDDDGHQVAGGVYFYRLRAGDFSSVRKLVLIK